MFWLKQLHTGTFSLCLLLFLIHSQYVNSFVVPQELQSALSLVYSNIPPIKKGTDSRLGFGFRLGEHADFQVLLELGPQKNTRPLGDPSKTEQSFNKRQVDASDQLEQVHQQELLTSTERNAASWLENWSNGMKPQGPKSKSKPRVKQTAKLALPQRPQVAMDAMQQLQLLYKLVNSTETHTTTSAPPAIITNTVAPFKGGPLNLGDPSGFKLPPPALTQDENTLSIGKPAKSRAEITKELMNVSLEA